MLNQAPGDRAALARLLGISETQQQYINNARKGSGLIWTGQSIIPFYDEFPTNTRLYALMSTNAVETMAEAVANDRMARGKQEMSEKEKADREYEEYQKRQNELYKDKDVITPVVEESKPVEPTELHDDHLINDMDDYPDDGFGPDPFAPSLSESGISKDDLLDDLVEEDDEAFPDEFDTIFGGVDSMFDESAKKPVEPPKNNEKPVVPQQKPAKPTVNKNQDALNSFFNI